LAEKCRYHRLFNVFGKITGMTDKVLNIAVIGAGYWGKNLVRNFATAPRCSLKYVCDLDEKILQQQKKNFPAVDISTDADKIFKNENVDAVVVSVDVPRHFELAKRSLLAGKHTFVEKPLTLKASEAQTLVKIAGDKNLKLMTGHLLEYHPAVTYIRELLDTGLLGRLYYMYTQRVNLGIVRKDENAWWSLAPHDISIICYLFGSEPVSVAASGQCYLQKGIEDVVFATIKFADGKIAHVHCSWLDPHKIRKMTLVGSEKMVTFDDMEASEKVRIWDKGAAVKKETAATYPEIIALRFGDIVIPKIPASEPLSLECKHFIDCILDDKKIRSDGADGLRVVSVLEAGQKSLDNNGSVIELEEKE
jgi:predicted dehydrogenase